MSAYVDVTTDAHREGGRDEFREVVGDVPGVLWDGPLPVGTTYHCHYQVGHNHRTLVEVTEG